jgi:hypothetical protein
MIGSPPNNRANDPSFAALEALGANGPDAERMPALMLFGRFIGAWLMDVSFFNPDGACIARFKADWLFSWILQGRAIQDVLISPCKEERAANPNAPLRLGTTLRYYDPVQDFWRVVFVGTTSNTHVSLIGRKRGDGILLEGPDVDGSPMQWSFSEITPNSFRWRGMISKDSGKSWYLEQEMFATRRMN